MSWKVKCQLGFDLVTFTQVALFGVVVRSVGAGCRKAHSCAQPLGGPDEAASSSEPPISDPSRSCHHKDPGSGTAPGRVPGVGYGSTDAKH